MTGVQTCALPILLSCETSAVVTFVFIDLSGIFSTYIVTVAFRTNSISLKFSIHNRLRPIRYLYTENYLGKIQRAANLSGAAAEKYVARRHASRVCMTPAAKVSAVRRRGQRLWFL